MCIEVFRGKEHDMHDLSSDDSEKKLCAVCVSVYVCLYVSGERTNNKANRVKG